MDTSHVKTFIKLLNFIKSRQTSYIRLKASVATRNNSHATWQFIRDQEISSLSDDYFKKRRYIMINCYFEEQR